RRVDGPAAHHGHRLERPALCRCRRLTLSIYQTEDRGSTPSMLKRASTLNRSIGGTAIGLGVTALARPGPCPPLRTSGGRHRPRVLPRFVPPPPWPRVG